VGISLCEFSQKRILFETGVNFLVEAELGLFDGFLAFFSFLSSNVSGLKFVRVSDGHTLFV
jgi:hypothetical protein